MERAAQTFASDLQQLPEMRAFVRNVCRRAWGLHPGDEAMFLLDLAVSEAVANIILHAYRGQQGRPIELIVDAAPENISVGLYHQGEDFDPSSVAPPAFDGTREGGFGVYLMANSVDEVIYCREAGRRGVRLIKNRK